MLISIIVASYNYDRFIKQVLDSLVAQTYSHWEAIVVDDGSTDDSVKIIEECAARDPRIKLYQHEGKLNKGLAQTIALGLEKAAGDWVAFCESDDWWAPECLEKRIELLEKHPKSSVIFNDITLEGENAAVLHVKNLIYDVFRSAPVQKVLAFYPKWNLVTTFSCAMVRKSAMEKCDLNCPLPLYLDRWIWTQLAFEGAFLYLDKPLTHWRQHAKSYTRRQGRNKADRSPKGDLKILRTSLWQLLSKKYPRQRLPLFYYFSFRPFCKRIAHLFYQKRVDARYQRTFLLCLRVKKKRFRSVQTSSTPYAKPGLTGK